MSHPKSTRKIQDRLSEAEMRAIMVYATSYLNSYGVKLVEEVERSGPRVALAGALSHFLGELTRDDLALEPTIAGAAKVLKEKIQL